MLTRRNVLTFVGILCMKLFQNGYRASRDFSATAQFRLFVVIHRCIAIGQPNGLFNSDGQISRFWIRNDIETCTVKLGMEKLLET